MTKPESVARNTVFAAAMQLTGVIFTGALTLFLVRALGPDDYGILALAVSIGALLVLVSDVGISAAAARFAAERRGDPGQIRAVFGDALRLKLVTASTASAALFVLAGPIADAYDAPGLLWPLRGVSIAVFAQSLLFLPMSLYEALGRNSVGLRIVFAESAIETTSSVILVIAGAGATGAAFGRAAGYVCAAALGMFSLARMIGATRRSGGGERFGLRRIARYAGAIAIVEGAMVIFVQLDVLLIGAFLGPTEAGLFEGPLRLTTVLQYPALAIASGVAPRLISRSTGEPRTELAQGALRSTIIVGGLMLAPIVVWASPIVDLLLGPEFAESADVFRALAPYVFLAGIVPVLTFAVTYLGEARRRVPIAIAAVLINLIIDLALIPVIGITAGAIGTGVAFAIYVPAHFAICRRALGIALRPVLLTLARSLLAAAAMAAVLAAVGTETLTALESVLGGLGGVLAYLGALLLTRELSAVELRGFSAQVGQRLPFVGRDAD